MCGRTDKPASPYTAEINRDAAGNYPMDDRADFADVERGLIARWDAGALTREDGVEFLDPHLLDYVSDDAPAPDSVNPALWRQSQVVRKEGLFQVVDHLYQVRGDSSLTIVDAPDGLVIIDTTNTTDVATASLELFRRHTGNSKEIVAIIYTHTHADHFGGVKGLVTEEDVTAGRVPIIAPGTIASFNKHAIGENVIVGNAMSRRVAYAFGMLLPRCDAGLVTAGIGPLSTKPGAWRISYIPPTDPITRTGEVRNLGGWDFEFLYAPDTEAPEEMHIWIPELKALTCAENVNHTMHNIQTLRGARTRDARNFARYIDETLVRWGDQAEVHFGPHTWPVWGNEKVVQMLEDQRDLYKYMYDQALRLANQGLTSYEAAESVELPDALGRKWYNRYYHGGLHHNVRAVFYKELGYWDGDPASILPLLPGDNARRHIDLVGRERVIEAGRTAIEAGDYRWAVQVLHHAVFGDPNDSEAKELQADAYEQLGYQQENTQYRAIFLTAAKELREGILTRGTPTTASLDAILAMPIDLLFDFVGVHVIGEKAAEVDLRINFTFEPSGGNWTMWVRNGVLNARREHADGATLTFRGPKPAIAGLLMDPVRGRAALESGVLSYEGDLGTLDTLAGVLDTFDRAFAMVTP